MPLSVERQDVHSITKKYRGRKRAYREGYEESRDA